MHSCIEVSRECSNAAADFAAVANIDFDVDADIVVDVDADTVVDVDVDIVVDVDVDTVVDVDVDVDTVVATAAASGGGDAADGDGDGGGSSRVTVETWRCGARSSSSAPPRLPTPPTTSAPSTAPTNVHIGGIDIARLSTSRPQLQPAHSVHRNAERARETAHRRQYSEMSSASEPHTNSLFLRSPAVS